VASVGATDDTSILFNGHAATNHTAGPAYTPLATMFAPDGITQIATAADVVNPTCGNVFGLMGPGQDCFGYRFPRSDPWTTDNGREPFQNLDTYGASITIDSKFGNAEFTSITGYEGVHKLYGEDTDGGPAPVWDWRLYLNGRLDELLYEQGVVNTSLPFPELRAASDITQRGRAADADPAFSERIRVGLPARPQFPGLAR